MIDDTEVIFPNNIVNVLHTSVPLLDDEIWSVRRPLQSSDPLVAVGIWGGEVRDDQGSMETGRGAVMGMGRQGMHHGATLTDYIINMQAMVKDGDEERGLARHSVLANAIRRMLLFDNTFGLALAALVVERDGWVERTTGRRRIASQRFFNNEVQGSFTYVATFEFLLETETV